MRSSLPSFLALAAIACLCGILHAHPGHAHEVIASDSGWHLVLQPEHALVLAVAIATLSALLYFLASRQTHKLTPIPVRRNR